MTGNTVPAADHVDRIMAVMSEAFDPAYGEAWTRRQVEDSLLLRTCHSEVIGPDGEPCEAGSPPAGFYMSRFGYDEEELLLLAVIPKYRRQGIARKLLTRFKAAALHRGAQTVFLEMRQNNPAEHLYRAEGFQPIGIRTDYYRMRDGARLDAVTFACKIADPAPL